VKKKLLLAIAMLVAVFLGRVMPHPYNFTPVIAITLLSSYVFKNKYVSLSLPLFALWLSDLFINNVVYAGYYPGFTFLSTGMVWTYGSILLVALLGSAMFKKMSSSRVALASISGIYYLLFNFKFWCMDSKSNVCKVNSWFSCMLFSSIAFLCFIVSWRLNVLCFIFWSLSSCNIQKL
jgi:hypothetical protein